MSNKTIAIILLTAMALTTLFTFIVLGGTIVKL